MKETILQARILKRIGAHPKIRVWRNNTGQAWTGNQVIQIREHGKTFVEPGDVVIRKAHPIKFGLPGSSDVIGVEGLAGRILCIENKSPSGVHKPEQKNFQAMIEHQHGIYILARSEDDVVTRLREIGLDV